MTLRSRLATVLWLVTVTGMGVVCLAAVLDAGLGYSPLWLEAVGLVAWAAAAPAFLVFLVLAGRARLGRRRSV
ncbi:MAG TPA: hypothetical protein VK915_07285 [Gaiellaceae bacterium]|nr:hypothetical protein [Gaiellaceae bacterium]